MAIRYSSGKGKLFLKDTEKALASIQYQLQETNPTQYTSTKWWGDFTSIIDFRAVGEFIIELEDGRRGSCDVLRTTPANRRLVKYQYSFNGHGPLGRRGRQIAL